MHQILNGNRTPIGKGNNGRADNTLPTPIWSHHGGDAVVETEDGFVGERLKADDLKFGKVHTGQNGWPRAAPWVKSAVEFGTGCCKNGCYGPPHHLWCFRSRRRIGSHAGSNQVERREATEICPAARGGAALRTPRSLPPDSVGADGVHQAAYTLSTTIMLVLAFSSSG